jgi:hypothetical protein
LFSGILHELALRDLRPTDNGCGGRFLLSMNPRSESAQTPFFLKFGFEQLDKLTHKAILSGRFFQLCLAVIAFTNEPGRVPNGLFPLFLPAIGQRPRSQVCQNDLCVLETPPLAPLLNRLAALVLNTTLVQHRNRILWKTSTL